MRDSKKIYSVVIADDHEIIRSAIRNCIESTVFDGGFKLEVLDVAENGLDALALVKNAKPDVMFLDISMPLVSGADIIYDVRRWSPSTKILVFTGITKVGLLASIVETGVEGLFNKGAAVNVMLEQLPKILQGGRYISPDYVSMIQQVEEPVTLTNRERQVLNWVIAGKTNKEVAIILSISPKTVDKHRTSLMAKLDVHSFSQLMAKALKDGYIEKIQ